MTLITADRVREISYSTGTGPISLGGVPTDDYQPFAPALSVGISSRGVIIAQGKGQWEVVQLTMLDDGRLSRAETPIASSNGGAPVDFGPGRKEVFLAVTSTDIQEALDAAGVALGIDGRVTDVDAKVSAISDVRAAPVDVPALALLVYDPATGRILIQGLTDGSVLADFRNRDGAVLIPGSVAQAMTDAVQSNLNSVGIINIAPLDAPDKILSIRDATTGRELIDGRSDGSSRGDFRDRSGSALAPTSALTALASTVDGKVAAVGEVFPAPPLDAPDTVISFRDPTTGRELARGTSDGQMLGDWRSRDGSPIAATPTPLYAPWRLRNISHLRQIQNGLGRQMALAAIGDSWTANSANYGQYLYQLLTGLAGSAGLGWCSTFLSVEGNTAGNITFDTTISTSAGWTQLNGISSPNLQAITSSTPGESIHLVVPAGQSSAFIMVKGTCTLRYRYNAGGWTSLPVDAALPTFYALAGMPGGGTGCTIDVELVDGTVTSYCIDLRNGSPGLRYHKLGRSGTNTADWTGFDPTDFVAGLTALNPDAFIIFHGTNNQWLNDGPATTPDEYYTQGGLLIDRCRTAREQADILLVTSPKVRTEGPEMSLFAAAWRQLAEDRAVAHLDLQFTFGDDYDEYKTGGPRELLNGIHPNNLMGRGAVATAFYRALVYATN